MPSSRFPWYDRVEQANATIEQGDILDNCKIFALPSNSLYDQIQRLDPALPSQELQVEKAPLEQVNLIVASQSCDLRTRPGGKTTLKNVLLCAFHRYDQFPQDGDRKLDVKNIIQGRQPAYHLLAPTGIPGFQRGLRIIDFRNVYVLPIEYVRAHLSAAPHLRLLPPYREHFSQAFARFFMRVGLPSDIDETDLRRLTP
jgi:hypothetical protein